MPLAEDSVVRYRVIRSAPAVIIRSGRDSSDLEKARYASTLIRETILSINDSIERSVGEAAFGLGHFAEQKLADRIGLLETDRPHISRTIFEKRRPDIIELVMHRLRDGLPAKVRTEQGAVRPFLDAQLPAGPRVVTFQAALVARLEYACLGGVFVAAHEMKIGRLPGDPNFGPVPVIRACEDLFALATNLIASLTISELMLDSDRHRSAPPDPRPPAILDRLFRNPILHHDLGSETADRLVELYGGMLTLLPFGAETYGEIVEKTVLTNHRLLLGAELYDLYVGWVSWYDDVLRTLVAHNDDAGLGSPEWPITTLDELASYARRILNLLQGHFDLQAPVRAGAQEVGRQHIHGWYLSDEAGPVYKGELVAARAQRFIEVRSAMLAEK